MSGIEIGDLPEDVLRAIVSRYLDPISLLNFMKGFDLLLFLTN